MKAEDYLRHYGVKLNKSDLIAVKKAMEDYKNQTPLLFQTETIFDQFIAAWNKANKENGLKGRIRVIDKKTSKQVKQLIDLGYSINDIINAYKKALADDWHKQSGYKHLTPEFITRIDKFNKFSNAEVIQNDDAGDYQYQY